MYRLPILVFLCLGDSQYRLWLTSGCPQYLMGRNPIAKDTHTLVTGHVKITLELPEASSLLAHSAVQDVSRLLLEKR